MLKILTCCHAARTIRTFAGIKYSSRVGVFSESFLQSSNDQFQNHSKHRQPPGFVDSHRWMTQRTPDDRLQSSIFRNTIVGSKSDVETAFLTSDVHAAVSGAPVTQDFSYQVVDDVSAIPLLDHRLSDNLCLMRMEQLTPVQRHAIGLISLEDQISVSDEDSTPPRVIGKYDLMAAAQTGSGKTLAYLIPILNRLMRVYPFEAMQAQLSDAPRQFPSGLVLVPTRELAQQIFSEAMKLCYRTFVRPLALYGGERPARQLYQLSLGGHLVIATPGRLLDFLRQEALRLTHCRSLVLDEADRMLDMGFEEQIREILESPQYGMPSPTEDGRQTCLFSATFPTEVTLLARNFLRGSQCISLTVGDAEQGTAVPEWGEAVRQPTSSRKRREDELARLTRIVPREIRQRFEFVEENSLQALHQYLISTLQGLVGDGTDPAVETTDSSVQPTPVQNQRVLIFCNTKHEVDQLDAALYRNGLKSASLHGDKSQIHRSKALELFRRGTVQVLVASSVAARGLDIPNVTAVINVGLPVEVDDYVHRIGRTGRMGRSGEAITVLNHALLDRASRSVAAGILQIAAASVEDPMSVPSPLRGFARQGEPSDHRHSKPRSMDRRWSKDRFRGQDRFGRPRSQDELGRRYE